MNDYRNNNNRELFWYGFRGNLKVMFGSFLFIIGIIFSAYLSFVLNNIYILFIGMVLFLIIGIYFVASGTSQRFDYQRQSGQIIHKGDW